MIAGVLHDLKTPMTIVSGYAQLMAQSDDAEQRMQYVDQILKQFDHMAAMTKEVLAFARGEVNVLIRKVFMHRFLAEVERHLLHEFAGKDVQLEIDAGYRGAAYFDEQKMMRVVHNIARNAAQAMPSGGVFRLTTRVEDDQLVLEFEDTGVGIPAEMEGRLFELFATAGKKDGSGLGLAIVKKIVDEHRGTISHESRHRSSVEPTVGAGPGSGTTFTVRIPLEKPAVLRDRGAHSGPEEPVEAAEPQVSRAGA
jgi:signal transduction histidine kinase